MRRPGRVSRVVKDTGGPPVPHDCHACIVAAQCVAMNNPIILSTWSFGQKANHAGWLILENGGASIDAVEAACKDAEADPANRTVGLGGNPDASGKPSLDAAIMLSPRRRGAVA